VSALVSQLIEVGNHVAPRFVAFQRSTDQLRFRRLPSSRAAHCHPRTADRDLERECKIRVGRYLPAALTERETLHRPE